MDTGQWGVVIAIVAGAFVLVFASAETKSVRQMVGREPGWKAWRLLHALMLFFLFGYLAAAATVLFERLPLLLGLLGSILLAGAIFVLLVVRATLATMRQMERHRQQTEETLRELKAAQAQLIQNGRLVALGHLAAGIAHELNQPLMAVEGVTALLKRSLDEISPKTKTLLDRIGDACDRMGRIVNNVRGFGRRDEFTLRTTDPIEPMDNALMLMNELLSGDYIQLEKEYQADLPTITADEHRLQQVFLNLLSNARDALRGVDEEQRYVWVSVTASDEDVIFAVEDSGPGVPEEYVSQLFDPFFTTKEIGEGTGIGLSISFGIALEHHGALVYARGERGGARFELRVPTRGAFRRRARQTGLNPPLAAKSSQRPERDVDASRRG